MYIPDRNLLGMGVENPNDDRAVQGMHAEDRMGIFVQALNG